MRGRPKKEVPEVSAEVFDAVEDIKQLKVEEDTTLPDGVDKVSIKEDEYSIEVIRDYYGKIDPFYLSKSNPKFEYRFLKDEQSNLSIKTGNLLFSKGGWQLCPREHLLKIGIDQRFISPDGLYRVGDTVLAFMPKELYNEKLEEKKRRANAPMDAVNRLIKDGDKNNPELVGRGSSNMVGLQTADQLHMK